MKLCFMLVLGAVGCAGNGELGDSDAPRTEDTADTDPVDTDANTLAAGTSALAVTAGGGTATTTDRKLAVSVGDPLANPPLTNGQHTLTLGIGAQAVVPKENP